MADNIEIRCVCGVLWFDRDEWYEHRLVCDAYGRANARRSYWTPPRHPATIVDDVDAWTHDWRMEQLDEQQDRSYAYGEG